MNVCDPCYTASRNDASCPAGGGRCRPTRRASPKLAAVPLLNLPPAALLRTLTADYLHAQLCHAALQSFAAENEARMEAMAAAHTQTERQLAALQATQRRVRQEEITAEIIELAAGRAATGTCGLIRPGVRDGQRSRDC